MTKGSKSKITHENHAFGMKRRCVWRLHLPVRTAGVNA